MGTTFVLRRRADATGPALYYPPHAIRRAEWPTVTLANAARACLLDASAWTAMSKREARAADAADFKVARDGAIRSLLSAACKDHGERAFTETPGDMMTFPQLRDGVIVRVPVVILSTIAEGPGRGYVAKFADNALRHLPHDWALDPCEPTEWLALAGNGAAS